VIFSAKLETFVVKKVRIDVARNTGEELRKIGHLLRPAGRIDLVETTAKVYVLSVDEEDLKTVEAWLLQEGIGFQRGGARLIV
jgi:hypothetical protein